MARIAYVDHSFHRTTLSNDFLVEVLERHGHHVQRFWDAAWQGGAPVPWGDVADHDVVLMFQSYCAVGANHFRSMHPNVIYVPMLDQFGVWKGPLHNLSAFWEPFHGSKVINFSTAAHAITTAFGIASHFARYHRPWIEHPSAPQHGLHGFFWLRREHELPWSVIRQLIGDHRFDSFHLHIAPDPGSPPPTIPSREDVERHRITTSTWFEKKSDLERVMARSNVYFAPRLEEGIGQSFLEAMSHGRCVVAPDHGTMNEYIVSGVNGLLYDLTAPAALDFSRVREIGVQARVGERHGRMRWEASEAELVRFVLTPSDDMYAGKYRHAALQTKAAPRAESQESGRDFVSSSLIARLRSASHRYALLRRTRFLWLPLKKLAAKVLKLSRT